jgi:hypothetical protein
MLHRYLLAAAVAVAFVVPATAATAPKPMKTKVYYAEQSVKTKACYVVTTKPNGKTATEIGTDSFKTLKEAAAAIKADKDCVPAPKPMKPKAPMKPKTT